MKTAALVLDFGGVISRTLFETHRQTEAALGLAAGTLTWHGPFDPSSDPLWRQMQAGTISERRYWHIRTQEVGRLLDEDWDRMEILVRRARGADPDSVIRPEALDAIRHARERGHKLAILSNELDLFYGADFRSRLPFLDGFDVVIDATYTGVLKPEARAYADCARQLGLPPSRCVMVDDQPRNVAGAVAAGMRAIQFDVRAPAASFEQALATLGALAGGSAAASP